MILSNTTETIELVTSASGSVDYYVSWADHTSSAFTPGQSNGNVNTATTTVIVAAPGASTQRQVRYMAVRNRSTTVAQVVSIRHDTSGTERILSAEISLAQGEVLEYTPDAGFQVRDRTGRLKVMYPQAQGIGGFTFEFLKIGTASEAIGVQYGLAKDSGIPGAWVPNTPGINGWWTDASAATNAANPAGATQTGSPQLPNAASGSYFLTNANVASSVAHLYRMVDLIWYNTGIVVTTTTAQAISQPVSSVPARDLNGSTNGEGWQAGIYVTTATTNAGAVTNTTLTYTNSEGAGSRTATIASFPATAVAGTFVPFQLQAGDRGIRSIQSVTLGTSYGGGAISLMMYRLLSNIPCPIINVGAPLVRTDRDTPGVRLYNGTALWWLYYSSATTATTMQASAEIMEK
jgi:hypothetical protein